MAKSNLTLQKRLAAQVAGKGRDKVKIDPTKFEEIKDAITKADIRALISQGVISVLPIKSPSKHRARKRHEQRKKGRQRGQGARKGKKGARTPRKRAWINRIRVQRGFLKLLRDKEKIETMTYRLLLAKAKGGLFRSKAHLKLYITQQNMLK